jgi:hypothetical protein
MAVKEIDLDVFGGLRGRSRLRDSTRSMNFSIYVILPAALGSGVYSASNRNEYQEQKNVSEE